MPERGRLLGIDYGTVRVGLAVSDLDQGIAAPVDTLQRSNKQADERKLREVLEDYTVIGVVIGLPLHMGGEESQKSREARSFGHWMHELFGIPITFWDERCTSAVAEEHLLAAGFTSKQRKARIDKLAAQIMLQAYLDRKPRVLEGETLSNSTCRTSHGVKE
ncbi:Putative Holliday junction resolvase [Calycomorphotria hydatis]|uniref:Putative pre-16S rRNA nuclease n=2 Tax=Calycomorphotria hydatis TaxID=2528027 RepID=A0A517T3I7_9PLAN|nr:Putative Holliday junction resolvase [Calycomorphotria hydatis]